jgi:hypothetical protein
LLIQVGVHRVVNLSVSDVHGLLNIGPPGSTVIVKAARPDGGAKTPGAAKNPQGISSEFEVQLVRGGQAALLKKEKVASDELQVMLLQVPDVCHVVRELQEKNEELQVCLSEAKEERALAEDSWQTEFQNLKILLEAEAMQLRQEKAEASVAYSHASQSQLKKITVLEGVIRELESLRVQAEAAMQQMSKNIFSNISTLECDLAAMQRTKIITADELARAHEKICAVSERSDRLMQSEGCLARQLSVSNTRILTLEQALQSVQQERDSCAKQSKDFGSKCGKLAREVQVLTASEARLQRQLADMTEKMQNAAADGAAQRAVAEQVRSDTSARIAGLESDLASKKLEIEQLDVRVGKLKDDLVHANIALDKAGTELSESHRARARDAKEEEVKWAEYRSKLAAAVNAGQAMRGALMGVDHLQSLHGEGLDALVAQVPPATSSSTASSSSTGSLHVRSFHSVTCRVASCFTGSLHLPSHTSLLFLH